MPTVHFLGNVIPAAIQVSIGGIPKLTWKAEELGLKDGIGITIRIDKSVVDVECEAERFREDYITELYRRAFDLSRACVDLTCFATGNGLTVFLHTFIRPDGSSSQLVPNDARLAAFCTAFPINAPEGQKNPEFDKVLNLVIVEPPLFMAMNDLILAITLPHHAIVNCARAIEGIRHLIAPTGTTPKRGWELLRQNLRVEKEYLEFVTAHSRSGRHGDRTFIAGPTTTESTNRAWIIMNRFLEFRKRGNQPLPESEFPTLS